MVVFMPGVKFAILHTSIAQANRDGQKMGVGDIGTKIFLSSGGFLTFTDYDTETLEDLKITDSSKALYRSLNGMPQVLIYEEVVKVLTDEERMAIVYHEIAHHELGHIEEQTEKALSDPNREKGKIKVIDDLSYEIEADTFSANIVGNKVMARALTKLMINLVDVAKQLGYDVNYSQLLFDPTFRARINALNS